VAALSSRPRAGDNAEPSRSGGGPLRAALKLIVGIAVSLACLYFATRGTDWGAVGAVLAGAQPGWILASVAVSLATFYIRVQRWRVLLRPLGDVAFAPALSATVIGFGASGVLPLRLGELVRPALLSRRCGFPMTATLSSVVLERLFDILLVVSCFLAVGLVYPVPDYLRQAATALAVLVVVGFVVLGLVLRNRAATERIVMRVVEALPSRAAAVVEPMSRAFLDGLGALGDARTVALVLGYTVYLWGIIVLTFTFAFLALDIRVPLVEASLTTVVIVAAFVFLPQGPGFVGTWQAGCVLALVQLYHVPKDVAVGYSLLTWVVSMVVNVGSAAVFLVREDISLRQLVHVTEVEAPATGTEG
jgi:hypothetical protein